MTRFFTTLAAVAMLGTCGFAQASSQADGPPFEIKPHHTGISVPNLEESPITQVIVTNTVPIPDERQFSKLKCLSIAPIIASAMHAVFEDTSVSEIFGGENLT